MNILLFPRDIFALDNKILIKVDNEIITSMDILNEINYINSINNNSQNLETLQEPPTASEHLQASNLFEMSWKAFGSVVKEHKFVNQIERSSCTEQ